MSPRSLRKRLFETARMVVSAIGKRAPWVLGLARKTVASTRRASYRRLEAANPVVPTAVLFKSYSGRGYACSPRAIFEAMVHDPAYDDYEIYWSFREPLARALAARGFVVRGLDDDSGRAPDDIDLELALGAEALELLRRAIIVVWGSQEYFKAHARTAYWFSNSVIAWHLRPREGQAYIQTWHGTPLKRLGCDIDLSMAHNALYSGKQTHARYTWEGKRFTYLLSPSPFTTEKLSSAFDLTAQETRDKVLELGYPRNDRLHTYTAEDVASVRRRLGIPAGKKVVVYCPTWRDDQHSATLGGYTLQLPIDFAKLRAELGDEYVVLFRAHYLIANGFDFAATDGFVIDASAISDINDLYLVGDVLVTDYSSVFFDFANLERPMVFYMYDLDRYENDMRGFYLNLDELPGPIVKTQAQLTEAILGAESARPRFAQKYARFRERFTGLDDGHAGERVLERVIGR